MIGMFINAVPVRLQTDNRTIREVAEELTLLQSEREPHEYTPLYLTQSQAPIPAGSRLFETLFVYENFPVDERLAEDAENDFAVTASQSIEAPHYPLSLIVLPGKELTLKLTYDKSRFDARHVEALLAWLKTLLRGALDNINAGVRELPFLGEDEFERVIHGFNRTEVPYPADRTLAAVFAQQVRKTPANSAVRDAKEALSYAELNARANRIAHALIARGVGPETLVGLCMERCNDLIAAILAIHKAGAGYVPLDPHYRRSVSIS